MAAPSGIYAYLSTYDLVKMGDLTAATIKLALLTSAYTPNVAAGGNQTWSNVSTNEIASGNGYSAGGFTLANKALADISRGQKLSSDNITLTPTGSGLPAWRYGVLYILGSLWLVTNPLLGYFLGDSAPADVPLTAAGNTFGINCPAGGWISKSCSP